MKDVADDLALIVRNAIAYIKELERQIHELKRVAKPVQEPVCWYDPTDFTRTTNQQTEKEYAPLYAAPPHPPAEPVQEPVAGAAKSVHDKAYSEVELAAAYQKGWSDAMLRRRLGPHIIKEGT